MEQKHAIPVWQLGGTDLHHLRVFVTVVETGGFSAAQVALNVALSTISRQVSSLETRLGLRLCQRGRIGFRLTDDGVTTYRAAKRLFEALEDFRGTIGAARGQLTGQLSLAIIENWVGDPGNPLAAALTELRHRAPDVTIDFNSLAPDDIEHAILDGRAGLGVGVFHQHRPGIVYEPIGDDPLELYCGRGHSLFAIAAGASPEEVATADLVRRAYLSEAQVAPKTAHLNSTAAAHQVEGVAFLILSGAFIGYLPVQYATRWVEDGAMRSITPEIYRLQTRIEIATRRGASLSGPAEAFVEILRQKAVHAG